MNGQLLLDLGWAEIADMPRRALLVPDHKLPRVASVEAARPWMEYYLSAGMQLCYGLQRELRLFNEYRVARGLNPVVWCPVASGMAAIHQTYVSQLSQEELRLIALNFWSIAHGAGPWGSPSPYQNMERIGGSGTMVRELSAEWSLTGNKVMIGASGGLVNAIGSYPHYRGLMSPHATGIGWFGGYVILLTCPIAIQSF